MFVKIENYYKDGRCLIVNIDNIICIKAHQLQGRSILKDNGEIEYQYDNTYDILCVNDKYFNITDQQYAELCKVLTKGV